MPLSISCVLCLFTGAERVGKWVRHVSPLFVAPRLQEQAWQDFLSICAFCCCCFVLFHLPFWDWDSHSPYWPQTHYDAKNDLELYPLPLPPKCWKVRDLHPSSHLVLKYLLTSTANPWAHTSWTLGKAWDTMVSLRSLRVLFGSAASGQDCWVQLSKDQHCSGQDCCAQLSKDQHYRQGYCTRLNTAGA